MGNGDDDVLGTDGGLKQMFDLVEMRTTVNQLFRDIIRDSEDRMTATLTKLLETKLAGGVTWMTF